MASKKGSSKSTKKASKKGSKKVKGSKGTVAGSDSEMAGIGAPKLQKSKPVGSIGPSNLLI